MASGNVKTATTLAYAAALLQIILTAIAFLVVLGLSFFAIGAAGLFAGGIGLIGVLVGAFWAWVDYKKIYEPMKSGSYSQISGMMLVVGILQLFLGGTIPGILILIAWFVAKG